MHNVIGFKERRYIEELRILTKSIAIDCIVDDGFDRIIYVVKKGDMGLAIGKNGENIRRMQKVLGKRIEMVEEGDTLYEFVRNILRPIDVLMVKDDPESGKIRVLIKKKRDLGIAIGKGGSNAEKIRLLCRRMYNAEVVDIVAEGE
ncbi:NusA-like transcription termination signal-binding factor [Methanogenium organophilum]|uniref:Probable transcription termination protein NusA n=1 Tax=Methanogenium organophilum TaxID=2199 RepID=A0A9X9S449_METOG|nr:NusA-like transcription termination signal-binding factor [Methanogenium organophilum]WAI01594.1 NusA-like transcription termination signal-binding factor [Methanogenium organophilum]